VSVEQNKNVALGDIVAGNKTTTIVYGKKSFIDLLNEKYKAELGEGTISGFISELQHYMDRATNPDVRGLADKLKDSARSDLIHHSELLKEKAAKKIVRFQTSRAAQEIFVWMLASLYTRFLHHVAPLIQEGSPRDVVDRLMHEKVVEPVLGDLGDNVLSIYPDEMIGLLYFLAGNCHIRWDKC
jgi:ABC-3C protein